MPKSLCRKSFGNISLQMLESRVTPSAGALDPTFGGDGKLLFPIGAFNDSAQAVQIQPDGKMVVAGSSGNSSSLDFAVARFNIDGTPDTTFCGNGKSTASFGVGDDAASTMVIQKDGKILLGGYSFNGTRNTFALARFNSNGTLDTSFNLNGETTTAFGSGGASINSITVQSDGRIIAAGSVFNGSNLDTVLVRYTSSGLLDQSFGTGGKLVIPIGNGDDFANAVAVQPNGKIDFAGTSTLSGQTVVTAGRLNSDGSPDFFFGNHGVTTVVVGAGSSHASSLSLQPDGKIVIAGQGFNGSNQDFALIRLSANGKADTSFSQDGIVTTPIGSGDDVATAVSLQPDGKIVVAGRAFNGSKSSVAVARYNAAGTLDTTFNAVGTLQISLGSGNSSANGLALQADGKIVVSGVASVGSKTNFALLRFNPDGSLDPLANGTGKVTTPIGSSDETAFAIKVQQDGKIVVGGVTQSSADKDFALVRYNADGSLDASFGTAGKVITNFGHGDDDVQGIAVQPDGKIVATGFVSNGTNFDFGVSRYNIDGSLDQTFGQDGLMTVNLGADEIALTVLLQPDGKIVVGGFTGVDRSNNFVLMRLNSDGSLDPTFIGNGIAVNDFAGDDRIRSLALASDGKIVAVGETSFSGNYDFAVLRYNPNGSLDTSFNGNGIVSTGVNGNDLAFGVALQPDGKIVVAGDADGLPMISVVLARYNSDGTLDSTFGGSGIFNTSVGGGGSAAISMALQPDGKIVAAGYTVTAGQTDFAIIRYNSDGTPDTNFDGDGKLTVPVATGGDFANAMTIQPNGAVVAAGFAVIGGNEDFALVRVRGDNLSPVTLPVTYDVPEDGSLSVTRQDYVFDPNDDALATELLSLPVHGKIQLTPYGGFAYTPDQNYHGPDRFSYKVTDPSGAITIGVIDLNVTPLASRFADPLLPGKYSLSVQGTDGDDSIRVWPVGSSISTYRVQRGNGPVKTISGVTGRIYANGSDGNDTINVSTVRIPTVLDGEAGNDSITGGAASDVLRGGAGDDLLIGGAGNDTFTGGSGNDSMDGGLGIDRLVESGDVNFVLSQGSATFNGSLAGAGNDVLLRARIEEAEITGGASNNQINASNFRGKVWLFGLGGNDTLIGSNGPSILVGGDGNDSLIGGSFRDILIGGAGQDSLAGGGSDDICIGGATIYDANTLALGMLLNEWNRPVTYEARVSHLLAVTSGGLNGPNNFAASHVTNDGAVDTLTGGTGRDWFITSVGDSLTDSGFGGIETSTFI